ncbi:MAG: hypothetical protein K0U86_13835 [Planctomycetes bacterium]|nr:hypothetical protein [Planctomycetota bacterium]MCH9725974.1 hypothetical protein [Planctomycetota bacterium]MCH9777127.1 hypothetical protein [Planctomycetota bacterium]MCH9790893.1 hypothetical protein [Planctomycetota bacterium]MDF1745918.1 hypothetical protein [Gimesia sp.]
MKLFSLLILCYILLIIQISVVPEATVAGSRPHLILVMLCFALFWSRDATVFLWGILAGLIYETFDSAIPGTGVLLLTSLVWVAFRVQLHFQIRSLISRFMLILVLAFVFDGLFHILNHLEAIRLLDLTSLAQHAAGNALYTAVAGLGLLVSFKIISRLVPIEFGQSLRNESVYESRFSH